MQVQEMMATHPDAPREHDELLARCIEACHTCAQACNACADACLAEGEVACTHIAGSAPLPAGAAPRHATKPHGPCAGAVERTVADEEAQDRTELAEDRTILANERTFAGWLRTGFAAVGIGLAFHVLFGEIEPPWVPRAIATVFLCLAMLVVILAERRAAAVSRRLNAHVVETARRMNLRLISWSMVAATAALIAALWTLSFP